MLVLGPNGRLVLYGRVNEPGEPGHDQRYGLDLTQRLLAATLCKVDALLALNSPEPARGALNEP
jgi:hypothetical protein